MGAVLFYKLHWLLKAIPVGARGNNDISFILLHFPNPYERSSAGKGRDVKIMMGIHLHYASV